MTALSLQVSIIYIRSGQSIVLCRGCWGKLKKKGHIGPGRRFPTQMWDVPHASNLLVTRIYVFAQFSLSFSSGVSKRVHKQVNEGGAPGVMPLFCHYSKWKLCLSMEKRLAQRCRQSFQARSQCIPGISAIILCQKRGEFSIKSEQKHPPASTTRRNCHII